MKSMSGGSCGNTTSLAPADLPARVKAKQRARPGSRGIRTALEFAADILQMAAESRRSLQFLLDTHAQRLGLNGIEAGLCMELSYGTVRMEIRLRMLCAHFFPRVARLPFPMRRLLLVAVYALLFADMLPNHALLDQTVESIKRRYGTTLARVANGGLRAVCREGAALKELSWYEQHAEKGRNVAALYYALPDWIYALWEKSYGVERAALLGAKSAARPASGLRVNCTRSGWEKLAERLRKTGAEHVGKTAFAFAPGTRPPEEELPLALFASEGLLSRQGIGSQAALEVLRCADWAEPIWDACAGQGTKTCALLEQKKMLSAASDVYLPRLRRISGECRRLGLSVPPLFAASAVYPPLRRKPNTILLDAPCSGLGVLAGRPDIRRRRTPEDVRNLVMLQEKMLHAASDFLPPGGKLAYITCTVNPAENEGQIKNLCRSRPNIRLENEWNSPENDPLMEGMYAALLMKN